MAYGGVVGYEPTAQPGAYMFKQANGASTLLAGPPAESLKAKLDASSQFAGQRVAGPGGGAPADTIPAGSPLAGSGALNAPSTAPAPAPNMSVSAPPSLGIMAGSEALNNTSQPPPSPAGPSALPPSWDVPGQGNPTDVSVFAPPPPPSAAAAQPSAAPHAQPTMAPPVGPRPIIDPATGINTGRIMLPDGRIAVPSAGTAAVTKEQLQNKRANGVMVATSGSESVTGGFEPSKEYLDTREKLAREKGDLIDQTAKVETEYAAREKALADKQLQDAANLRAEEQARANEIQARVAKDEQTKDRLTREYGSAKVDPRRLFSGPGGGARAVLAALSAGLGAAGSGLQAMGGHPAPNYAAQAIDAAINRDIAAQETEIKVKGDMAQNALTQFQRSGLSLEQAKSALRSAQLGWAAAQNQQSASTTKGSMVEINAKAMHQGLSNLQNEEKEDYRQKSLGTATKAVAGQVQYAHGASGGGLRVLTPQESEQVISNTIRHEGEVAGTAKTIGEIGASGGSGQAQTDFNKSIQFLESGQGALNNIVKKAGGEMDPKTGKIAWKGDVPGAGFIARAVSPVYESDEAGDLRKAVELGAAPIEKAVEGDAAGEAGIKQIKESYLSGNAEKRRAALEYEAHILAKRRKDVEVGTTEKIRNARETERRKVGADSE